MNAPTDYLDHEHDLAKEQAPARDTGSLPVQSRLPLQQRVHPWLLECFGAEIASDKTERNHRFLEEAIELAQACGCTQSEAQQLVGYVFGRPIGEPHQEVGGVMITLAALCLANGLDMDVAGEDELARIWTKVEKIRAKQAAKPKHSPLPEMPKEEHNTFVSRGRCWITHNAGPSSSPPCDAMTEVAVLNRDDKIETGTARSFTWGWTAQSLEIIGWYPLSLEERIAERDTAILDLNQRLIDRTTGFQQQLQQQQLDIAHWKAAHTQAQQELLSSTAQVLALRECLAMDQPCSLITLLLTCAEGLDHLFEVHGCDSDGWESWNTVRKQARDFILIITNALTSPPPPVILLSRHESELRAQEHVTQTYRAAVTAALDAAAAPTHHPATDAPHRKPMMPCERIHALAAQRDEFRKTLFDSHREAHALAIAIHHQHYRESAPHWEPLPDFPGLITQIDNMHAGVRGKLDEARSALTQAYVHNQNMHCFSTKGRLNDQIDEQTHLLRKALSIPGARHSDAAPSPVQWALERAAFEAGKRIEYTRLCIDNGSESWASWWAEVTDSPPDWNNERLRFRIAPEPEEDPYQSEDYQRHVAEVAQTCAADYSPCDSCLAGGICDGPSHEDEHITYPDQDRDGDEPIDSPFNPHPNSQS